MVFLTEFLNSAVAQETTPVLPENSVIADTLTTSNNTIIATNSSVTNIGQVVTNVNTQNGTGIVSTVLGAVFTNVL